MTVPRHVRIGNITVGNDLPLALIAGPCVIESRAHALETAEVLSNITRALDIPLIYKSSFDKANRTSATSERGLGMAKGLPILAEVGETVGCPVLTDVHSAEQCAPVAEAVDVLQIPAFLCRQTDLLLAAAATGRTVNVKKGQFLAPWDMKNVVDKVADAGNPNILVCERGASFGYNTLVSDMRSLPELAATGCPVVYDATHSVQQPGGQGTKSGGQRQFVPVLARAVILSLVLAVLGRDADEGTSVMDLSTEQLLQNSDALQPFESEDYDPDALNGSLQSKPAEGSNVFESEQQSD